MEPHVADHRPLPGTARPRPHRRPPPRPPPAAPPASLLSTPLPPSASLSPSALHPLQLYRVYKSVHILPTTCVRQYKDCVSGFSENVSGVDLDGDALAEAILLECGVNLPPTHEGSFSFTAEYCARGPTSRSGRCPCWCPRCSRRRCVWARTSNLPRVDPRLRRGAAAAVDEHGVVGPRRPPRVDRRRGAGGDRAHGRGAELNIVV